MGAVEGGGEYRARTRVRHIRFWIESVLAGTALVLGLLTLVWRDWIEALTGFDPDQHSGGVEWLVAVALSVYCLRVGFAAPGESRRARPALSTSA
jgi:hypothetical protein